jgi:hypothetical protein
MAAATDRSSVGTFSDVRARGCEPRRSSTNAIEFNK